MGPSFQKEPLEEGAFVSSIGPVHRMVTSLNILSLTRSKDNLIEAWNLARRRALYEGPVVR